MTLKELKKNIKDGLNVYKKELPVLLFAIVMLKFSGRWQDSAYGYVFFPMMFFVMLRMPLEQKLHILIFLMPFSESMHLPTQMFGITGFEPVNILFLMILFSIIKRGKSLIRPSEFNKWIFLFICAMFLSMVRGWDITYASSYFTPVRYFLGAILKPVQLMFAGIMAFYILREPKQIVRFLRVIKLSGVLLGGYVLLRSGHTPETVYGMTKAVSIHKNSLSFIFLTLLAMNLTTMDFGEKIEKVFNRLFNVVYILAIMFTFSRQGYVSCVIVLFLFCLKKGFKWVVIYFLCLTSFWFVFIPFQVKRRIYVGTETGEIMGTKEHLTGDITAGREAAWSAATELAKQNILIGRGRYTWVRFIKFDYLDLPTHPHNAYLQSVLDNGVIGSIFIVGFYVFLMMKSWFVYKRSKSKFAKGYAFGFFLTILIFLLQGYTGFRFYPHEESYFVWFYLGGMMWVSRKENQEYLIEHGM